MKQRSEEFRQLVSIAIRNVRRQRQYAQDAHNQFVSAHHLVSEEPPVPAGLVPVVVLFGLHAGHQLLVPAEKTGEVAIEHGGVPVVYVPGFYFAGTGGVIGAMLVPKGKAGETARYYVDHLDIVEPRLVDLLTTMIGFQPGAHMAVIDMMADKMKHATVDETVEQPLNIGLIIDTEMADAEQMLAEHAQQGKVH